MKVLKILGSKKLSSISVSISNRNLLNIDDLIVFLHKVILSITQKMGYRIVVLISVVFLNEMEISRAEKQLLLYLVDL